METSKPTSDESLQFKELVENQRKFFFTGITRNPAWRKAQLKKLYDAILLNEKAIFNALYEDLNKSEFESLCTETGLVLPEIRYQIKNLARLSKPKKVKSNMGNWPSKAKIYPEPYGVSLIMSPWNYPFMLSIEPLVDSIAAGNTAIIKPSRYSENTSKIIQKIIEENFPKEYIAVVQGGHIQNTALLEQKFDFIFFTGSSAVGRVVMEAASKNVTPLVLELGGKSPCIVDKSANIKTAAKKIVWGKFLNAGQTCVCPDYILVHSDVKEEFLKFVNKEIKTRFGKSPLENKFYPKIINQKHFERLLKMHDADNNPEKLKIAPTIVDLGPVSESRAETDPLMQQEIFGPFLPVISYQDNDDLVTFIRKHPTPLALYVFSEDKNFQNLFINNVRYGGGCINDVNVHLSVSSLPFGGIGESGLGSYHGDFGFSTFTHYKSVLTCSSKIDNPARYKSKYFKIVKSFLK